MTPEITSRSGQPHPRHQAAVTRSLEWADEAAGRHDYQDALAWLRTLEAIGEHLPVAYRRKKEAWTRSARASAAADAAPNLASA